MCVIGNMQNLQKVRDSMERLTERNPLWIDDELWERACEPDCEEIDVVYRKLKDYEDAEEQGLLLRLPCKVGDIVYKVNKASKKISKHRVLKIEIEKMEGTDFTTQIWFENYDFTFAHRFGEVIFFTREEAEAKLKEMEEKDA